METLSEDEAARATHADATVSHVIPSVELRGSRGERLETLDALIARLLQLRHRLAARTAYQKDALERSSRHIDSPEWPWFMAGTSVGAIIVLLLLFARSCA